MSSSGWGGFFSIEQSNAGGASTSQTPLKSKTEDPERKSFLVSKLKERQTRKYQKQPISQLQSNPDNPLYSISTFAELPLRPELRRSLNSMNYIRPSKVQGLALPIILNEPPFNLIAQSQSGTGKTATFVIGMLNRVNLEENHVQCLCVAPTFELANQVGQVIEQLGQHMPTLKVFYAVRQTQTINSPVTHHIVVGTPGKLLNLLENFRTLDISRLKVFVLDEADIVIHQGETTRAIDIYRQVPSSCQILLLSATYSDNVLQMGKEMAPNARMIKLEKPELPLDNIEQYYIYCHSDEQKILAIKCIYENMGVDKAIIFCNTIAQSNLLFNFFVNLGYKVVVINSSYDVHRRTEELTKFKREAHVLISTNVVARGLDIAGVKIVINFEVPVVIGEPDYETYLHRIGRSGRFGDIGFSFTFVSNQKEMQLVQQIGDYFGKPLKELRGGDSDAVAIMADSH